MQQKDLSFLKPEWRSLLEQEFKKPYMENIREFLRSEINAGYRFFPEKTKIFRALEFVDYSETKVVILGQDPYHGLGQANGLAFAVNQGVPLPPSLQNIFKEIAGDFGGKKTIKSDLEDWAKQGVLLLNAVLTVRENTALSHREKGWETFTDRVISLLNARTEPIVFLLWGAHAQAKGRLITNPIHKVLKAPHPSPLSAHRGFMGCKHFSKTNEILKDLGREIIVWN